jgi:large subunit ribosomal protein L15
MRLNQIADNPGSRKDRMRVGRGIGSGKGKTGGRGVKGQKARTGVRIKGFEGGQMPIHRRQPKRGFRSPFKIVYEPLNLDRLQRAIDAGKIDAAGKIGPEQLLAAGVIGGKGAGVRLLAKGELKAKVDITVAAASVAAAAAVEKLGGSVTQTRKPKEKAAA